MLLPDAVILLPVEALYSADTWCCVSLVVARFFGKVLSLRMAYSNASSKEEYLKRYLSGPDSDTKPKKKKKKLKNAVQKTTQSRLLFKVYLIRCMRITLPRVGL